MRYMCPINSYTPPTAHAGDSMLSPDGTCIGTITSAGWGHRTDKNIAMGFVDAGYAAIGTELQVDVIGEAFPATVVQPDLYDPEYSRVRS